MMEEAIKNFPKQFAYEPVIENGALPSNFRKFTVVAMGGSALAAEILKAGRPEIDLLIHKDYGLPLINGRELVNRLIILISYSGNTEEVISAFHEALNKKMLVVIAAGGKLIELAEENSIPFVRIPNTGIQPRMAVGFLLKALMKVVGDNAGLEEIKKLEITLDANGRETDGKTFAESLHGKIPVVCASRRNEVIARNWKIKFNETGKIPAFYNVFPELNHNEMTGFDVVPSTRALSAPFHFIFLKDASDDEKISKRMDVCKRLYEDRGLPVSMVELSDNNIWIKIFTSLVLVDWTAYYLAQYYGTEPEQVPMVEEFKKMI